MTDEQKPASPDDNADSPATAATEAVAPEEDAGETTQAAIAELESERARLHGLLQRTTAEFDNFRKRTERQRSEAARRAAEDLLLDLLPLVDDLERALSIPVKTPDGESYRTGVELIHRQLLALLRKREVTPVDAVGEPFDPNVHEAVTQEPSNEHPEGTVVREFRRGYRLGDQLLRAAMVIVSAGSAGDDDAQTDADEGAVAGAIEQP